MSECTHPTVVTWAFADTGEQAKFWSCVDCRRRFEPLDSEYIQSLQRDAERYRWLRAMAATRAKSVGLDASALLGHKSARTTDVYLRDRSVPVVSAPSFGKLIDRKRKS